ncbi:iron ABC transporter substrate-binding protein, partial [Thermococcus sp. JdF3]|nr:iron ABC transporter substrate-binding protein [Thermococcus sp. JdF3]
MRKALALLLVLLVVSVSGCIGTTENPTNTATTEASSAYVTVTDLLGRTVEVPA